MSLRTLATIGWICFGLDVLFVLVLFVTRNVGDDAAGRGMARGFAMVLGPIVLALGAGLYWAQRSGSFGGVLTSTLLVGLPFLWMATNVAMGPVGAIERAVERRGLGKFNDPRLTQMASAIEKGDTAALAALAHTGTVDWNSRDRKGRTILGIAADRASRPGAGADGAAMVRILVETGAPYRDDAVIEGGRLFSEVVYNSGDQYLELMDVLLTAGANPNDTESYDGRPLLLHHNMTVGKARVLMRHGAELVGIRDSREDRPGWNALMNAAYMRNWPLALFYLQSGCDPRFRATDGKSVIDAISDAEREESASGGSRFDDDDYRTFRDSLDARLGAARP